MVRLVQFQGEVSLFPKTQQLILIAGDADEGEGDIEAATGSLTVGEEEEEEPDVGVAAVSAVGLEPPPSPRPRPRPEEVCHRLVRLCRRCCSFSTSSGTWRSNVLSRRT